MNTLTIGKKPTAFEALRYLGVEAFRARNRAPSAADLRVVEDRRIDVSDIPSLVRLAAQGHVKAQFILGSLYDTGRGVERNRRRAVELYRLAAEGGEAGAMFNVGVAYHFGRGVPTDMNLAIKWFRAGAEAGEPKAMNNLASLYAIGTDLPRDLEVAVKWARKSAKAGDADGMMLLVRLLEWGDEPDPEAEEWLYRAADAGEPKARERVARLRLSSAVVEDRDAGLKAIEDLAAKQDYIGMTELGRLYEEGTHVERNLPRAYALYGAAIGLHPLDKREGTADLLVRMIHMLEKMSEEERVEARLGILSEGGLQPLLVVAHMLRQVESNEPYFNEGEALQELAIENGAGTMRYGGLGMFVTTD